MKLRFPWRQAVTIVTPDPGPHGFWMSQQRKYASYSIGDWSYGNPEVYRWNDETQLKIGKFCSFATGVMIMLGGEHRTDWVTTYPFSAWLENARKHKGHPSTKGDVVIGHDVWIGTNAIILSGVTIGHGSVIGASSVVSKDIDPYSIVAGNPARKIRDRFSDDVARALLEIAWWDWPFDKIKEAWPLLMSSDLSTFVEKYHQFSRPPV